MSIIINRLVKLQVLTTADGTALVGRGAHLCQTQEVDLWGRSQVRFTAHGQKRGRHGATSGSSRGGEPGGRDVNLDTRILRTRRETGRGTGSS